MPTLEYDESTTNLQIIDVATCLELLAGENVGSVESDEGLSCKDVRYVVQRGTILFQARCPTDHLLVAAPGTPVTFTATGLNRDDRGSWTVTVRGCLELATDLPSALAADRTEGQWLRIVPDQVEGRRTMRTGEGLR